MTTDIDDRTNRRECVVQALVVFVSARLGGKHLSQSVDSCTLVLLAQDTETMHLDPDGADKSCLADSTQQTQENNLVQILPGPQEMVGDFRKQKA